MINTNECCGLLVNGRPLADFGGAALLDYTVGETPLENSIFQGLNRTNWHLLASFFKVRTITLNIVFEGETLHEAKVQRSLFNAAVCSRKCELFIADDGFYYSAYCNSTGAETVAGIGEKTAQIKSAYSFTGMRHDELQTVIIPAGGGTLLCRSTVPFTDCRLTVKVGANASSYSLGGATFGTVKKNNILVFDGIDGKITKNGSNVAATTSWTNFPSLVPGENTLTALDAITVEYYPTYI